MGDGLMGAPRAVVVRRIGKMIVLLAAMLALFLAGRALSSRTIDFIVYHHAARQLIAGRTDVYAEDFGLRPPMRYVNPPFFIWLISPLGRLSFANACGLWLALLMLSTFAVARSAWRAWDGGRIRTRAFVLAGLAGPFVIYGVRSGNVQLLMVTLTLASLLAWRAGRTWRAALFLALAGAIKVFPLLLLMFFAALREWRIVRRVAAVSAVLWLAPALYFSPARLVLLNAEWLRDVASTERLHRESRLDVSLIGACQRWLSETDYSQRIDRDYPQVNFANLDAIAARRLAYVIALLLGSAALAACAVAGGALKDDMRARSAMLASLWMTTQLLVGPYTTLLYLSGWMAPALALPFLLRKSDARIRALVALASIALTAVLLPGRGLHRALEAAGIHTLVCLGVWILTLTCIFGIRAADAQTHRTS